MNEQAKRHIRFLVSLAVSIKYRDMGTHGTREFMRGMREAYLIAANDFARRVKHGQITVNH